MEPNWHVIFLLLKEKNKLSVTEIANFLGFSHPAIIKITQKMKEEGYLETHKDSQDGRKTLIQISNKGRELLPAFEKEWLRIRQVLQEFVDDDFLQKLTDLEQKLHTQSFADRYQNRYGRVDSKLAFVVRNAKPSEHKRIGQLMVKVYAGLEGFPKQDEQPAYYKTLEHIGEFTQKPGVELLVAITPKNKIIGGVLYFGNMKYYGSGGTAPLEKNASGFRLLAVHPDGRGLGVGKALSLTCIEKAKKKNHENVVIHTTEYMKVAWKMYEKLGFKRALDLDFVQVKLKVYGFRLKLE
ncbi:GNAT family N-acetyltransferase [Flagellimonas sp.]|uniref:GNAT family N-acetyltransferase n=1 Tax=Flagellimonas sp. TaxID=2058762 RepID=UPI003B51280F